MSSHCLQIQEVKCLLGCVLLWRRSPCPEAPAHTLLYSITQVKSHSSISSCQRRFLVVAGWGLQRRGHSCWETGLITGISGINDLVSVVWVKGKTLHKCFRKTFVVLLRVTCVSGMDFFSFPCGLACICLPSSCIHQTLSLVLLGPLHFFFHKTTAILPICFCLETRI